MALYTRSQFKKLCGLNNNSDITINIQRGKIVLSGEFIDDEIQPNRDFLRKRLEKIKGNLEKETNLPPEPDVVDSIRNSKTNTINLPDYKSKYDIDTTKGKLINEKLQQEIALLQVKKQKAHGMVIPTDLVKNIFSQHTKTMLVEFNNAVDKIMSRIAKKYDLKNHELSEMRRSIIDDINISANRSVDESKSALANIVNQYSDHRGVGEHD